MSVGTALSIRVPHGEQEPGSSFGSRLGGVHGCAFNVFCLDMGISPADLIHGKHHALARLESLGGLPAGSLLPFSVRRTGDGFILNGQPIRKRKRGLRRERIRVCPLCIADDIETFPGPVAVRPYARAAWRLTSIRSCPRHRTALISLKECLPNFRLIGMDVYDFPRAMRTLGDVLGRISEYAVVLSESPFENYLLGRLWGPDMQVPFLDALPWYAAAQSCEIVGAVSLLGSRYRTAAMSETDWHRAGIEGFRILSGGELSLKECLERLRASSGGAGQDGGLRTIYGRLYKWLAHESVDDAYAPLRKVIKEHALETLPLGPHDKLFGATVHERRLHSVRSVHLATGKHPRRLRKLLVEAGIIGEEDLSRKDGQIVFPAGLVDDWLGRTREAKSLNAAGAYLNVPRGQLRMLYEEGFIRPFVEGGSNTFKDHAFAQDELDGFLRRLLDGAKAVTSRPTGKAAIPAAAKQACCSAGEIVRMVLERKLSWTGRLITEPGFLSLLVDVNEVRELVRREDHGGYSLRQVERLLATATHAVTALIGDEYLRARTAINPVNRCPQTVVPQNDVDTFRKTYISLSELSWKRRKNPRRLLRELRETGVNPAIVFGEVKRSYFFRRVDLLT